MIHGVIGANGAGKTTLLRTIAGLDKDYLGHVLYNGKKYGESLIQNITYISQKPYMLKRTVFENVAYPLRVRKLDKNNKGTINNSIENKVMQILKMVGIEHLKDHDATVLSAGEREKVSLARGLVFNPELILMDEPTASIDPESVKELEKVIIEYQRRKNSTVIVVTHNLSQALRMCDTISVLQDKDLHMVSREELFDSIQAHNQMDQLMAQDYKILGV